MASPKNAGSYVPNGDVLAPNGLPATTRISYVATTSNPEYVGWANTGSLTSAAVWRIKKLTYGSSPNTNDPVAIEWANGTAEFLNIWDNRASLSYS